jgi:molybdate transport system substrate-binding protein
MGTLRRVALGLLSGIILLACSRAPAPADEPLRVAAAADLSFAFEEMGKAFEAKTGKRVVFTFGSTGMLAKQIAEGARYDVFAAANVSFVDDVIQADACLADTKAAYGRGRIVLWTKKGGPVAPPASLAELAEPRFVKIAIANPEHAPYGRAAKQAMESDGVWATVSSRIVHGENVQQTLQFARTGNAEVAVVAYSLALAQKDDGVYTLIDESLHKPIDQALVVCKRGADTKAAREFASFVGAKDGREIMKRYGFVLPGEAIVAGP